MNLVRTKRKIVGSSLPEGVLVLVGLFIASRMTASSGKRESIESATFKIPDERK